MLWRSPRTSWLLGLLMLGVVIHAPLLWGLARLLWGQEHYQHFPIIVGAALWLAYQRWTENTPVLAARPSALSLLLTAIHLPLLAAAYAANSHWLGSVAFLVYLAAVGLGFGGWQLARSWAGPWFLLWLCLPLPLEQDVALVTGLQQIAAGFASGALDLAGLRHGVTGVAMHVPGQTYFVAEACSGVNSLFSSAAFMAFYLVYRRHHALRIAAGLAQTVIWVLVINALRVFLVVYCEERLGISLADGWRHQLLGGVSFALIVTLSLSGDYLLMATFPRKPSALGPEPSPSLRTASWKSPLYPSLVACLTVIATFLGVGASLSRSEAAPKGGPTEVARFQESDLPQSVGSWKLTGFQLKRRDHGHIEGPTSAIWEYTDGANALVFSVDGPFPKWHDLSYCYQALDWRLLNGTNKSLAVQAEAAPEPATILEFYTPDDERAWVMFCCYDAHNRPVEPLEPSGNLIRRLWDRVAAANPFSRQPRRDAPPPIIQTQLAVMSPGPLYQHEREKLETVFDLLRRHVRSVATAPGFLAN